MIDLMPEGHQVYINPNYIIAMVFQGENEDFYGNKFNDHYVIAAKVNCLLGRKRDRKWIMNYYFMTE